MNFSLPGLHHLSGRVQLLYIIHEFSVKIASSCSFFGPIYIFTNCRNNTLVKKWTKKCLFRLFFLLDWPSVNLSFSDALNTIHGFVLFFRSGLVEGLTFIFSWFARFGHKEIQKSGFFGRLLEVQFFSWTLSSLEFDFFLLLLFGFDPTLF